MLLTLGAVVVVLGVLIFVHEMGHFVAAKAVGIQVLRFSLGFGRPVLSWRRGETDYWISWLPLGGYVKMAGLEEEGVAGKIEGGKSDVPIDPTRAFDRQPVWKRIIVIAAGVTMNVVLAVVLFAVMGATFGVPRLALTPVDSVATADLPGGAQALTTLPSGARIVRVNGDTARDWQQLTDAVIRGPVQLRLELAGRDSPIVATLPPDSAARHQIAEALVPLVPPRIGVVYPGLPAYRAGLRPGDLVVRIRGDSVRSWGEMVRTVRRSARDSLRLRVLRDGRVIEMTVVPEPQVRTGVAGGPTTPVGVIGAEADLPLVFVPEPLSRAFVSAFPETWRRIEVVVGFVKGLVVGDVSLREVGGPLTIGQLSGQVARLGLFRFLDFMAFLSVNLAILNLLPIPLLDGGQLMFLIAEAIRRKPLSLELRTRLMQVGVVVLFALMILALTNDVLRIFPH